MYTSKLHYLYKLIKYFCKLTSKQGGWLVFIQDILKIVCKITETKLYFEKKNINLSIWVFNVKMERSYISFINFFLPIKSVLIFYLTICFHYDILRSSWKGEQPFLEVLLVVIMAIYTPAELIFTLIQKGVKGGGWFSLVTLYFLTFTV